MPNFIELPGGTIVDVDKLTNLYVKNVEGKGRVWMSMTTEGKKWTWTKRAVPLVRAAMMARDDGRPMPVGFICDRCGAPNVIEDEE